MRFEVKKEIKKARKKYFVKNWIVRELRENFIVMRDQKL